MEGEQQRQTTYENLNRDSIIENNEYELRQVGATEENGVEEMRVEERRVKLPEIIKKWKNMELTWNKPIIIIIIIILLSLIVILLVAIFGLILSTTTSLDDLPTSCEQLKIQNQNIRWSDYYILASTNGSTYTAYCNTGLLCGSIGWTRLAYLDMSDATQNCPSGFRLYQSGGVKACGRPVTKSGSCVSVQFPSNGISYSQICGRVTGYQYQLTDAIKNLGSSYRNDLNSYYVDGASITHGSPREHVWTLMAGYSEVTTSSNSCPCNTGSSVSVQSFIGNDYFCESGNPNSGHIFNKLYTSDPLWDGQGCGSLESPCCNVPGIPWFHRDYGSTTTTDYIELRVCGNEGTANEDSPVSYYEIYIK